MALINFPSGLLVHPLGPELDSSGPGGAALRLRGRNPGAGRGPGYWTGRLEIAETDHSTDAQRRAMELFLTRLRGAQNTFDVPLYRPSGGTLVPKTVLSVSSAAANTSGVVEITVTGAATGLVAGDYVSINSRLYQLTRDLAGSKFRVEPPVKPAAGKTIVWENVTCRARLRGESRRPASWTPDFGGPWTLEWEEAV